MKDCMWYKTHCPGSKRGILYCLTSQTFLGQFIVVVNVMIARDTHRENIIEQKYIIKRKSTKDKKIGFRSIPGFSRRFHR